MAAEDEETTTITLNIPLQYSSCLIVDYDKAPVQPLVVVAS